jgi:hypothetical protein
MSKSCQNAHVCTITGVIDVQFRSQYTHAIAVAVMHVHHLHQVFQILQQQQWNVKLSMCSFAQRSISYLGFVISSEGVSTCPKKIAAVAD